MGVNRDVPHFKVALIDLKFGCSSWLFLTFLFLHFTARANYFHWDLIVQRYQVRRRVTTNLQGMKDTIEHRGENITTRHIEGAVGITAETTVCLVHVRTFAHFCLQKEKYPHPQIFSKTTLGISQMHVGKFFIMI